MCRSEMENYSAGDLSSRHNHIHSSVTFHVSPRSWDRRFVGKRDCKCKIRIHEDLIRVNSNFHLWLDDTLAAARGVRSEKIISQSQLGYVNTALHLVLLQSLCTHTHRKSSWIKYLDVRCTRRPYELLFGQTEAATGNKARFNINDCKLFMTLCHILLLPYSHILFTLQHHVLHPKYSLIRLSGKRQAACWMHMGCSWGFSCLSISSLHHCPSQLPVGTGIASAACSILPDYRFTTPSKFWWWWFAFSLLSLHSSSRSNPHERQKNRTRCERHEQP